MSTTIDELEFLYYDDEYDVDVFASDENEDGDIYLYIEEEDRNISMFGRATRITPSGYYKIYLDDYFQQYDELDNLAYDLLRSDSVREMAFGE